MKALRLHAEPLQPARAGARTVRAVDASKSWRNPRVALEEISTPVPNAGELLLQVEYSGLCGSDYHLAGASETNTICYPGLAELPVTIGHEFSGRVTAHSEGMSEAAKKAFPVGAIVTAEEMLWCGECSACRAGHLNHCENLEELGFTRDGAHAEYVKVHSRYCWRLDPLIPRYGESGALRLGALVEPYSVSYRALFQGAHGGKWLPGNKVLLFGAGPIGIAAVDLALAAGAAEVHVVEPVESRRELAIQLGASLAVSPDELQRLPREYDWIVDAAGTAQSIELASSHLEIGGSLCLLARTNSPGIIAPESLITHNTRIFGSQGHSGESAFPRVIALMAAGKLRADRLIGTEISLEQAAEKLNRQEKHSGKVLVRQKGI